MITLKSKIIVAIIVFIILSNCLAMAQEIQIPTAQNIDAKGAVLMEASTGQVLFEKEPNQKLPIASVTKTMVMLLAIEAIDSKKLKLTDSITGSEHSKAAGGSTIFLDAGEVLSAEEILKGIILNSGNDAATAMAEHLGGSEPEFVKLMNKRALELGMKNTHYVNCTGLDIDGHYSTAYDIALITRELLKHPKILEYSVKWTDTIRNNSFEVFNTNKLLQLYPEKITGLKTGFTDNALHCISATARDKKTDMSLIAVILGSTTSEARFNAAIDLFEYGYNSFIVKKLVNKGEELGKIQVIKGEKRQVPVVAKDDVNIAVLKTQVDFIKKEIMLDKQIKAPCTTGQKVGELTVKAGDKVIAAVPAVIEVNVKKLSLWQGLLDVFKAWLIFDFKAA